MSPALLLPAGAAGAAHPCAAAATRCDGTIHVPLNWADPASERIDVGFAWVPRRDRSRPATGTVLYNGGGPGDALATVAEARRVLGPVLRRQNLLVVGPRGFGRSSRLECDDADKRVPATLQACAARLGERVGFFSSDQVAADIDAVRAALGVPALTFFGNSYGTLFAQAYATRYPARTAAVFLDSAVIAGHDGWASWSNHDSIRSGVGMYDAICRRSRACRAHVGRPSERLEALLRRLRARPDPRVPTMPLASMTTFPDEPVFGRELGAAAAAYVRGDPAPLRRLVALIAPDDALLEAYARPPDLPALLAYNCGDYALPFDRLAPPEQRRRQLEERDARTRPARPFTVAEASPPGGGYDESCAHWRTAGARPPVPPGARYPDVPVLAVGGQLDTTTPPQHTAALAVRFPRSTSVTVPFGTHAFSTGAFGPASACVRRLMLSFVARPRASMPRPRCNAENYRAVGGFPRTTGEAPRALARGLGDRAARRVGAAFVTLADAVARRNPYGQFTLATKREPGLRGGALRFRDATRAIRLDRVRFVSDLTVTGWLRLDRRDRARATVRLSGGGRLRLTWRALRPQDGTVVRGALDGRRFRALIIG